MYLGLCRGKSEGVRRYVYLGIESKLVCVAYRLYFVFMK